MQCRNHPDQNGVNTCNQCGSWLCEGCTFERGGRIFCPSCAAQQAVSLETTSATPPPRRVVSGRYISWGLLFLFSVVIPLPGLNYMYMGLIKRGLAAMASFFIAIYVGIIMVSLIGWLSIFFWLILPLLYFTVTFDGFQIRHRLNAGEAVGDDIDGAVNFLKKNRLTITTILLSFAALIVISIVAPHLVWLTTIVARLTPFIIVGVIIYMLIRKKL